MTDFYYVGGSVPLDSPSYINREADELFYNALKSGRYCYVLNSRQMGKSSLWVQTQKRLIEEEIRCATIDLSGIGKDSSEDVWYQVLFYKLVTKFELSIKNNRQTWWNERADVSAINRLDEFIEEVLLREVEQPIVICLDEIDSVLSLNFSIDGFFAWMRSCHEKRPHHPIYQRLTFCMLGVATVSNFIRENARSPLNIGRDIPLSGFTKGEAGGLARGLEGKVPDPRRVLEEVLEWTGGQPFLTQKICNLIYTSRTGLGSESSEKPINVGDFVQLKIINNWESQDSPEHLDTIRKRLLNTPSIARRMLLLYQEILDKGDIIARSSPDQIQLRLTGLVVQENQKLKVYNKIYREIFNETWVERELSKIPPYIEKYEIWFNSGEDSTKLLSGQTLQEALTWSENKPLNDAESRFLKLSQIEEKQKAQIARQQEAYQRSQTILSPEFPDEKKRTILINEILGWTGNQLDLVEIVCRVLIENKDKLIDERESTEGLIKKHLIENWQQNRASSHLQEMQNYLLAEGNIQVRLRTYQDILQGRVFADDKSDKLYLQQVELVVKNEDYLEVANRIYKAVFNLQWVNQELEKLINEAYQLSQRVLNTTFSDENKRTILINEILSWTGNQLDLVNIVCNILIENKDKLMEGEESTERLIQKYLIENWQQNRASNHLQEIQNHLLAEENIQAILGTYQDILRGRVFADDKPEKISLQQAELVVKNEDYLEVTNEIYKEVFNLKWVNQELEKLVKIENQPAPATTMVSLGLFILFVVVSGLWLVFKPKNLIPPSQAQIPKICTQRDSKIPLEDDIQQLQTLESQQGNAFPQQCKTQLTELKLIQDAIRLAKNSYMVKTPENTDGAFLLLCKIPVTSKNIRTAQSWVTSWYKDPYWKEKIDKALKDKTECSYLIKNQ